MSKAFTRESDDAPEPRPRPRLDSSRPPGTKNYLTPDGARRLQEELNRLIQERSTVMASPKDSNERRQVTTLDERILQLQQSLQTAVIAPAAAPPWEHVRFGATVTVRDASGAETRYRIVGVDETDLDRNWVSWLSPLARALLNARIGQHVRFKLPAGEEQLEVVGITYE
jgi:transcription elongation factor GreB